MSRPFWRASCLVLLFSALAALSVCPADAAAPRQEKNKKKSQKQRESKETALWRAFHKTIPEYPEIDDPKLTVAEFLDRLGNRYGLNFHVNEAAFRADGLENVLGTVILKGNRRIPSLKNTTPRAVLKVILARLEPRSSATFVLRKDAIEVTTEAEVRRELGLPMPKLADDAKTAVPPTPLVWEHFQDEPLAGALGRLAEGMEVTILVDPRVKKEAATRIDATLRNVPTATAVTLLCDTAGLAVVERHDTTYYVTSPENAARLRQAKAK